MAIFFLCSPDCPKQPRASFPFYKFFYTIVSAKVSDHDRGNCAVLLLILGILLRKRRIILSRGINWGQIGHKYCSFFSSGVFKAKLVEN